MTLTTNQKDEQYRAGFEAAARRITHAEDFDRDEDGYRDYVLDTYWRFWLASKREASTEPSAALVDCIKCEGRGKHAMFDGTTLCDGACAQCGGTGQVRAGALTDDAKDAARYRFIRNADLDAIAAGNWRTGRVLDGAKFDDAIDAAIEAHKTGSGK